MDIKWKELSVHIREVSLFRGISYDYEFWTPSNQVFEFCPYETFPWIYSPKIICILAN